MAYFKDYDLFVKCWYCGRTDCTGNHPGVEPPRVYTPPKEPLMRYKVKTGQTAQALREYWLRAYNVRVQIDAAAAPEFYEIYPSDPDQDHPMWRELNDAFVSGRQSVVS